MKKILFIILLAGFSFATFAQDTLDFSTLKPGDKFGCVSVTRCLPDYGNLVICDDSARFNVPIYFKNNDFFTKASPYSGLLIVDKSDTLRLYPGAYLCNLHFADLTCLFVNPENFDIKDNKVFMHSSADTLLCNFTLSNFQIRYFNNQLSIDADVIAVKSVNDNDVPFEASVIKMLPLLENNLNALIGRIFADEGDSAIMFTNDIKRLRLYHSSPVIKTYVDLILSFGIKISFDSKNYRLSMEK